MSSGVAQPLESSSKLRKIPKPAKTGPAVSKIRAPSQTTKTQAKSPTKSKVQTKPANAPQNVGSNSKPSGNARPQRSSGIKAPTTTKNVTKSSADEKPSPKPKKTIEPRTRHKRTARAQTSVIPTTVRAPVRVKKSEPGPVAPPRSGAGIKRSVTTRQSSGSLKSMTTSTNSKAKLTKHPSLEKERSFSSESNSNESIRSVRQPNSRVLKTKQVSSISVRTGNQPKRNIKRPSTRVKPDVNRSQDNYKENVAVKYTEAPNLHKSKSKESLSSKVEMPARTRRSSLPSVIINPAELLLNRSLHEKLSQNRSNRHGFVLTDTDVSMASLSSEFLSGSNDERSDHEMFLTGEDLKLKKESVSDSNIMLAKPRLIKEDKVAAKKPHAEESKIKKQDSTIKPKFSPKEISSRIAESSMNDLSDPNRSPSLNINPDEAYFSEGSSTLRDTSTLRAQDLQVIGMLSDKYISDKDWNGKIPDKAYTSPDDNFQGDQTTTTEKELYYDSSDLSIDSESISKEINTVKLTHDKNMSISLKEKAVDSKEVDIQIQFPENNDSNAHSHSTSNATESPNEVASKLEDILSPLSNDSDPLAMLHYSAYGENTPVNMMHPSLPNEPPEISSAPSSVILSKKFPDQESFFRRSTRSIHPKKSKQLVRSTSLDKKFLAKRPSDLHSGSLDSFDYHDIYIVENLSSASPISLSAIQTKYFSPVTPEILVTDDTTMFECADPEYNPKRRFIMRTKQRNDVVRRFSETQVFKHHKEKYLKKMEKEEKYSSCPVSSGSPEKLDSPRGHIKGLVKRVSSMLNSSHKPRILVKKDRSEARDSVESNGSGIFIDFNGEARSLHDEMPDAPQNMSGSDLARVKRCNSLEFDEISSIRRPLSDRDKQDNESPDYGLTHKAKSISEQLERFRPSPSEFPPLEFQTWTDFVPESVRENLSQNQLKQQHHIWELVTTEHNHITILSTIINTLLQCLRELHTENFLTKIDENNVFLNIENILRIHLRFWEECIVPLIQTAKDTGELLNPEILTNACSLFEEELNPLFDYCIKYSESKAFIKTQQKNNDFKEYINWCDNQTRSKHHRLELNEVLITPIQRIQKYPYIINDIRKKTTDEDTRRVLGNFHEKVSVFVESLNRRKEEKEEQQTIENIKERIESYSVLPVNTNQQSDQINQLLAKYNKFDLADKVPLLEKQRKFIHENPCKLSSTTDSRAHDVILFLFSDLILITRPNKSSKKKNRIIKQPLTLDKVVIEELKDSNHSHTNLLVYLNEYGSLTDMFLLQSANQESQTTLLNAVTRAKDNYIRDKNNLYTELDGSKSLSTTSVNSSSYLTSPSTQRHQPCLITRSSSEHYPPTRRANTDPSTSVGRTQSMPASNDKRDLRVEQNMAASSASSSASSSSASVSDQSALSIDSSSKSVTLSDIKELDKGNDLDDSDEMTIKSGIHTLNKYGADDIYIADNLNTADKLSSDFKGKLDINKTICESVLTSNEREYLSKTDNIYIENEQS